MELVRQIDPVTLDALSQPFFPVLMVSIDWPDAPAFAHTGVGDIVWDGHIWTGVGPVGDLSVPAEAVGGVAAVEAVLSLVGVPVDLDGMLDDPIRGREVSVYFAVVAGRPGGADGKQTTGLGVTLVGSPAPLFYGAMDALDLDTTGTATGVSHEARVTIATGPSARSMATIYHTEEDQRRRYPGDTAGRHLIMALAKAQKMIWPAN